MSHQNGDDPFEDRLRDAFHARGDGPPDVDSFLSDVHRGARTRRTARALGTTSAAVAVIAVGGYAVTSTDLLDDGRDDDVVATAPTATRDSGPTPTSPTSPSPLSTASSSASRTSPTQSTKTAFPTDDILNLDLTTTQTGNQYILGSVTGGACGSQRCAHTFQTSDGGSTWKDLGELPPPTVSTTATTDTVDAIRFSGDGRDGWAFREDLWSTHDAGRTWTEPELPVEGNVITLEAWGDDVLAVVDTTDGAQLLHSSVGEDAWEVVTYAEQIGLTVDPLVVSDIALSEQGAVLLSGPYDEGATTVLTSSDGGLNWDESGQPCRSDEYATYMSVSAGSVWLRCQLQVQPAGPSSRLLVSNDLGATWSDVAGNFSLNVVFGARDDNAAVVVEPDGGPMLGSTAFEASLDAAGPVRLGPVDLSGVTSVGFTDPRVGYALKSSTGEIQRTLDGGRSWSVYAIRVFS